jgi:hypothetical protein
MSVHQVKLWGTPFTLTYPFYGQSHIGDVRGGGVVIHHNIDLKEWLGKQYHLRALMRKMEHKRALRRMRAEGRPYSPRKLAMGALPPSGHPVQIGYVVTEESPVHYAEVNGCLRPLIA